MKALINSTAILSLTLYVVPPFAVQAQDLPMAQVGETQVVCLPDDQTPCPDGANCVIADAGSCQANAEATFAAPAAEAPAVTEEQPAATEEAPAATEEQPAATEEAPAAEEQPVATEEAPAATEEQPAATEEAPAATEEQPAATEEAPAATEEQPAATEQAPATEEQPAATEQAPATEEQPAATEEAPAATEEQPAATEQAPAATEEQPAATEEAPAAEPTPVPLTEEQVQAQAEADQAAIEAAQKAQEEAAAAAAADPNLQPVEAPVVEEQAAQALTDVLDAAPVAAPEAQAETGAAPAPEATAAPAPTAAAATEAAIDPTTPPTDQPVPEGTTVTTETVTEADTRSAAQEFAAAPVAVAPGKKSGLSDLEKAGLVALGALAIGTILKGAQNGGNTEGVPQRQVVQNTGDRVVVRQPDGSYVVYKDDNALLREPGSKVTTQTFQDGSTRTIVARADGSQIATIRDASGRVLQRVAYDTKGRATVLIDDLKPEAPIVVSQLPKARPQKIDVADPDAAMRAALAAAQAEEIGAKYSLRQIRTIPEVRHLAPTLDVRDVTFASGSAALDPDQAKALNGLGGFISKLIAKNPGEVFLIEGHTDAVGSAASNLTLSDRRAETVAKALTEYFGVPPENMVVQGYGESELLIPSAGDERANRRVEVRIITPILRQ